MGTKNTQARKPRAIIWPLQKDPNHAHQNVRELLEECGPGSQFLVLQVSPRGRQEIDG